MTRWKWARSRPCAIGDPMGWQKRRQGMEVMRLEPRQRSRWCQPVSGWKVDRIRVLDVTRWKVKPHSPSRPFSPWLGFPWGLPLKQVIWTKPYASTTNLPMYEPSLGFWWPRQGLLKLQGIPLSYHQELGFWRPPEDCLANPLLNPYLHHQEIRVSLPLCFNKIQITLCKP